MPASPKFSTLPTRQFETPTLSTPTSFNSLNMASLATFLEGLRPNLSLSATSIEFILLCLLWYFSSALSNNSLKQILINFNYPVTLTFVQFGFIAGWCMLLALVQQLRGQNQAALFGAKSGIRAPSKQIILTTLPMTFFQIAGHIFGSLATSEIPVSVVHTVKVVPPNPSPLMTANCARA
jgi:solute carrier family 35, member E1